MAIRSGIAAQVGWASESAYGTFVTPDRFIPLLSEGIQRDQPPIESQGIVANRLVLDDDGWFTGPQSVAGPLQFELYNLTIGELLEHAFGTVNTTGAGPYTHTFTPADTFGKSLSVQVGRPGAGGTIHPFSYTGVKVGSWEIACAAGEIARMTVELAGREESTAQTLASASYATGLKPFVWHQAAVTLGGSAFKVKNVTLRGSNPMDTARRFLGQALIDEPIENDLRVYDGELVAEFTDLTAYNRFVNGTTAALVVTFTAGSITLTFTLNVRFDGTTPNVGGRGVLEQPLPFKAIGSTDAAAITAVLVNTDATP